MLTHLIWMSWSCLFQCVHWQCMDSTGQLWSTTSERYYISTYRNGSLGDQWFRNSWQTMDVDEHYEWLLQPTFMTIQWPHREESWLASCDTVPSYLHCIRLSVWWQARWTVEDFWIMVQLKKEMYIKSVSILSTCVHGSLWQWSWLEEISDTCIDTLLELLQLVTKELSFKGIMIRIHRIGPLLDMFNSIQQISFSDIQVRKFPVSVPPSYLDPLPSILPIPGQEERVGHKNLVIELCSWQDTLLLDKLFQQCYSSLVTFELWVLCHCSLNVFTEEIDLVMFQVLTYSSPTAFIPTWYTFQPFK